MMPEIQSGILIVFASAADFFVLSLLSVENHTFSKMSIILHRAAISLFSGILTSIAWTLFSIEGTTTSYLAFFCFISVLIWLSIESFRDFIEQSVPTKSVLTGSFSCFAAMLVLYSISKGDSIVLVSHRIILNPTNSLMSGLLCTLFSTLFVLASKKRGLGTADIGFFAVMGLINGYPGTLNALYITVFSALTYGLLVAIKSNKIFGIKIPFIPFISIGTLIAFLLGQHAMIALYL